MSRDADRVRRRIGTEKKQCKRPPVRIVHLDGDGRALCGLPAPWPSDAHALAAAGQALNPLDICLTCKEVQRWKSRSTPKS